MFRKIVSNLSFSPALVGQLAFYAKRLRKEQTTRRVGLVFVILAVAVQCLTVFSPPQSANAASGNDFVYGGLGLGSQRSLNNFLVPYDNNTNHLQDIMNYFGISRSDITNTTFEQFTVGNLISYGHDPVFSYAQGERAINITNGSGQTVDTIYGRPLKLWDGTSMQIWAYVGHSPRVGWFAIMQACGNLVTTFIPGPPTPPAPKPAPANIVESKTATNVTQGNIDATKATAKAGDEVRYTLTAKNTGGTAASMTFQDNLQSTLQYAALTDPGGGTYNATTHVLSWPAVTISPGQTITHSYLVKMNNPIVNTSGGTTCSMVNVFGNSVTVNATCTPANIVQTKSAVNVTQGNIDATTKTANAGDNIDYTLNVKNTGGVPAVYAFQDNLALTLQYSHLVDQGGGTYNASTQVLSWPSVTIEPGQSISRSFSVQVDNPIPATAQGTSNQSSYNCTMNNVFGEATPTNYGNSNDVVVHVNCPAPKVVEQTTGELPHTGPTENMLFAGILLAIVTYFYLRTRQVGKEVRLIRRDLHAGAI